MIKTKKRFYVLSLVLCVVSLINCTKGKKVVTYQKYQLKVRSIEYTSKEIPDINHAARSSDKIYVIFRDRDIWEIDLPTKKEKKITESGFGPDEIYKPLATDFYGDYCWINSLFPNRHIFRFHTKSTVPKIESIALPHSMQFDDFVVLPGTKIAGVNVYWQDSLLKVIDLETGDIHSCGKAKRNEIMLSFNVNKAAIAYYDGSAYVIQSTAPVIEVFSLAECKKVDDILLEPPFYKEMPGEYKVNKFKPGDHRKWMSGWTSLKEILIRDGWILLRYRKGYEKIFYYEMIDLSRENQRIYIDETTAYIYDFKIAAGKIHVAMCEEEGNEFSWQKGEIII